MKDLENRQSVIPRMSFRVPLQTTLLYIFSMIAAVGVGTLFKLESVYIVALLLLSTMGLSWYKSIRLMQADAFAASLTGCWILKLDYKEIMVHMETVFMSKIVLAVTTDIHIPKGMKMKDIYEGIYKNAWARFVDNFVDEIDPITRIYGSNFLNRFFDDRFYTLVATGELNNIIMNVKNNLE